MIELVAVVVPAHDEQALLPACLASVQVAAAHPDLAGRQVRVVVALDSCTDGTARVAAARGADTVSVRARNVGVARAAGVERVLATHPGVDPARVWLAMTDADSRVPADWLAHQLRLAETGVDAVVGTVAVDDWRAHPPGTAERFAAAYDRAGAGPHRHVHGANLGLRATAYRRAGGVAPLALAEDHALVERLAALRVSIVRSRACPVTTSARVDARARGGFGDSLLALARATLGR